MEALHSVFEMIKTIYNMGNNIHFFGVSLNGFLIGLAMFGILLPVAVNTVKVLTVTSNYGGVADRIKNAKADRDHWNEDWSDDKSHYYDYVSKTYKHQ